MACRSFVIGSLPTSSLISPSSFPTSPWYIGALAVPKHTKYSIPTQGLCTYPSLCLQYLPPDICTDHPTSHSWVCSHVHATIRPFLVTVSTVSSTLLNSHHPYLALSCLVSPGTCHHQPHHTLIDLFIIYLPKLTRLSHTHTPQAQALCFVAVSPRAPVVPGV